MSGIGAELIGRCAETQVDPNDVVEQLTQLQDMDPGVREDLSLELAKQCLDCTVEKPGSSDMAPAD